MSGSTSVNPFSLLPGETRNQIYANVLDDFFDGPITIFVDQPQSSLFQYVTNPTLQRLNGHRAIISNLSGSSGSRPATSWPTSIPPLHLTCRLFRNEYAPLLYRRLARVTFAFEGAGGLTAMVFGMYNRLLMQNIRSLSLTLHFNHYRPTQLRRIVHIITVGMPNVEELFVWLLENVNNYNGVHRRSGGLEAQILPDLARLRNVRTFNFFYGWCYIDGQLEVELSSRIPVGNESIWIQPVEDGLVGYVARELFQQLRQGLLFPGASMSPGTMNAFRNRNSVGRDVDDYAVGRTRIGLDWTAWEEVDYDA